MTDPAAPHPSLAQLERHRNWLALLARMQVEGRYRAKFDPSDVVQQTMLEAVRAWSDFQGRTDEERAAWLRQILARVLLHEIRRYAGAQRRALGREISLDAALEASSRSLGQFLAASDTSPSARLERHEKELRVADALARLPEDYQRVIVLRNIEGLPHEEVARRMDRGVGAVRMLWVRALARLRDEIERP
jgi:RNA polymerase sigma-70 factor (ECF subfamily)